MDNLENINKEVKIARRELKNIRQEMFKIKAQLKSEVSHVKRLVSFEQHQNVPKETKKRQDEMSFPMVPIGVIASCFKYKNGIPRQHSLCQAAKATLEINKTYFTNPEHSLYGLKEFTYIWILFVFHKNKYSITIPEDSVKAKVHPPRLNGVSVGVFSTRSPHRPCPIGLSLVKLEKIIGNKLYLSGVDLLDGSPVLDIKPYIPAYDVPEPYEKIIYNNEELSNNIKIYNDSASPKTTNINSTNINTGSIPSFKGAKTNCKENKRLCTLLEEHFSKSIENCKSCKDQMLEENSIKLSDNSKDCLGDTSSVVHLLINPPSQLNVTFTNNADRNIENFHSKNHSPSCEYCLNFLDSTSEAKKAIVEVLQNDPRSVYRRTKCADKLYYFEIDKMHVTCWFDETTAEIVRVKPTSLIKSSSSG